jgi:hypothetical protein
VNIRRRGVSGLDYQLKLTEMGARIPIIVITAARYSTASVLFHPGPSKRARPRVASLIGTYETHYLKV